MRGRGRVLPRLRLLLPRLRLLLLLCIRHEARLLQEQGTLVSAGEGWQL
jgi:hypothetical protein